MDSERRHELETNDLREFLDNFKDFWEKHGNKLLFILIIVLGGYAGYNYYGQWQQGKEQAAQEALAGATTADQLLAVSEEHPQVFDEAMRRAGDVSLGEARTATIAGSEGAAEKALKKAGTAYSALADRGVSTEYKLVGLEGLAKTAVMGGKWDEAAKQYQALIDLAGQTYTGHAARAQADLDRLDLLKNPVAFSADEDLSFNPDELIPPTPPLLPDPAPAE